MTFYIVILTMVVSIWAFYSHEMMHKLIFNAYSVNRKNEWYRFITCGFIHADWLHLIINMYVMYSFGSQVENEYDYYFENKSTYYFLLLYFGGIIISILPSYLNQKDRPGYNSLGASGGVSSVIFVYILLHPNNEIHLFPIPFGFPAVLLGGAYLIYSFYMDKKGGDNVNHNAHFWGAIYGIIYTLVLKPGLFMHFVEQMKHFSLF